MVGAIRWLGAILLSPTLVAGTAAAISLVPAHLAAASTTATAQEPAAAPASGPPATSPAATSPVPKPDVAPLFSQPGDDPPRPFVPLHPSTVDDRQRTEALRLYTTARGLEDRGSFQEAVTLLQQAQKLDPDSVAIVRRLSRIYLGALSRPELAVEFGKKVLAAEPDDTETLSRLVEFYLRKNDLAGCQTVLKDVLANPRLEARSPGRLLAQFELGKLYAEKLNQPENAARAYAEVLTGLDDKTANRLSPADLNRILGNDPATAYLNFGNTFLEAKRDDLAVRAFERGLIYDEENPQIPLQLAETLLKQSRGEQRSPWWSATSGASLNRWRLTSFWPRCSPR